MFCRDRERTTSETPSPTADAGPDKQVAVDIPAYNCTTLTATATGGNPPYAYLWSTGETTASITVCPTTTTTYSVEVRDANENCPSNDAVTVEAVHTICGPHGDKALVCHDGKVICVARSALPAHLGHGDRLGTCAPAKMQGENESGLTANCYPNPFSEETTISFSSKEGEYLRVEITDLSGKQIAEIWNGYAEPGMKYEEVWKGENIAAGMYLLRITSGSGAEQYIKLSKN
jgi:hypothetical protein